MKRRPHKDGRDRTAIWLTSWCGFAYDVMMTGSRDEKMALLGDVGSLDAALKALTVSWAIGWTKAGRATVNVPSRLAASMACSSADMGELRMPYGQALLVRIGPGVLVANGLDYQYLMLHAIVEPFRADTDPRWCLQMTPADESNRVLQKAGLHRALTLGEFLGDTTPITGACALSDDFEDVPDSADNRLLVAGQAIMRGVLLLLTAYRQSGGGPRAASPRRVNTDDAAGAMEYDLVAEVTLDLRERVASFCGGRSGHKLEVRHLVRGHFKRQHSKAGEAIIWVQPYWRGPVDGPLAARSVVVPEVSDAQQ